MCQEFTGPHSVLQIFLGKLVYCINDYAESLKDEMKKMNLWIETKKFLPSSCNSDSNLLKRTR